MAPGDVLIVDDSVHALEIMAALLESRGHSVRKANGGRQALSLANSHPPDLVLLDVHMPDLDGFEVCKQLRQKWSAPTMPVMFLSAANDANDKVRAFALGGVDYVTKPFQFDEVLARVELHLQFKRVQQQALERAEELERVNTQLRRLEESRRTFLAAVVHDLKNPLTPVLKNTEWLLAHKSFDEESTDVLRDVHFAANHMHRMVLSLLDVARSDEGALVPHFTRVALKPWLDDTLALTRLHLRSNPERLIATVIDSHAQFDPTLLSRVVQNLIDNALKYSPHSRPVRVAAEVTSSGGLRVVVEDEGKGVPVEARERVFMAWAQLERDQAPARTSHGLGLAFCRQAVKAHGGSIHIEDADPHGARFVVELPGSAR